MREERLDEPLIINQTHLRRVMRDYVEFFNTAGLMSCRNVLDDIIHDYYRDAA